MQKMMVLWVARSAIYFNLRNKNKLKLSKREDILQLHYCCTNSVEITANET